MKIITTDLPAGEKKLSCTYPSATFKKYEVQAIKEAKKHLEVPGFRKGAVPDAIAEKHLNTFHIRAQAVEHLVDATYKDVLETSELRPILPGQVSDMKFEENGDVTVDYTLVFAPTIKLDMAKVKKVSLKRTDTEISDTDVEQALKQQLSHATHFHGIHDQSEDGFQADSQKVTSGDQVIVSCQGYSKKWGDAIPETQVQSHTLIIGSGNFIPWFEEELIGLVQWEMKGFNITFPADYHSDAFKSRKVYFETTIESISKPHVPELTPELIGHLFGFESTPENLKQDLKQRMLNEKLAESKRSDEKRLIESLEAFSTVEISPALLQEQAKEVLEDHKKYLVDQGYTLKDMLAHSKSTEEHFFETVVVPEARRRMITELIYAKLVEVQAPELSEEEIQIRFNAALPPQASEETLQALKKQFTPGNEIYNQLVYGMKVQKIIDSFFA